MTSYDEQDILNRLSRVDRSCKTAFAAACAERLMPLFRRYSDVTGRGDPVMLEEALDRVWRIAAGEDVTDLREAADAAEAMVPSEDDEWAFEMGYGENAAAGVAYAVRTWLSDDAQAAVWAARQLYEAADHASQHATSGTTSATFEDGQELAQRAEVQAALSGIAHDLVVVETGEWTGLRQHAREHGKVWAAGLPKWFGLPVRAPDLAFCCLDTPAIRASTVGNPTRIKVGASQQPAPR